MCNRVAVSESVRAREIDRESIETTEHIIRPYLRLTPMIEVSGADLGVPGATVNLKLEQLQRAGSFKTRGAFANLLLRTIGEAGVAAASGGNHGTAVAYAAGVLGVPAKVFVPTVSAPAKIERIKGYGADLVVGGELYADALASCERWVTETLLGQGSLGLELERQLPEVDSVLVAVGGGGLIGGLAAWFGGRVRVIGVEPEAAPTLHAALAAGRPVDAPAGGVAADALAPRRVGELMFPIAQSFVERVVLVPDEAIVAAQGVLWDAVRLAVEPAAATALAALRTGAYRPAADERVAVIISGANTGGP
jgi:threonine dehydratase